MVRKSKTYKLILIISSKSDDRFGSRYPEEVNCDTPQEVKETLVRIKEDLSRRGHKIISATVKKWNEEKKDYVEMKLK